MKRILYIIIRMTLGFFFCSCGTVMALNSKLGLSPWDVFHQGLSNVTGLTIGQANIMVGVIVVIFTSLLGIEIGIGTIANMIVIGCFTDFIIYTKIIPMYNNLFMGIVMMTGSLFVNAIGSYLYIGCEIGCGPRDGLMIALMKLTGKPISLVRFCIESAALIVGFFLGGIVGIGTLITVFGIGYCVQIVFKVCKFDVNSLKHRNLKQSYIFINKYITKHSEQKTS